MTNWYAVYTRARLEKKVAEAFTRRNIESYCPVQEAPRPWLGKKVPPAALFPNYVFVRLTQEQLTAVKKVEGVINLVYWLGRPAVIRDIEIEMIRRFVEVHKQVVVEKTAVDSAAMVKLSEGPVVQREGSGGVVSVGSGTARLSLPSLGWRLSAQPQPHSQPHFIQTVNTQFGKVYSNT